jgi:hypothetical protein
VVVISWPPWAIPVIKTGLKLARAAASRLVLGLSKDENFAGRFALTTILYSNRTSPAVGMTSRSNNFKLLR